MRCLPQRREHPEIARPHDRIHRKTLHCHGQCPGGNLYCKNDTVDIAGGMRFIGQLLLVLTLDKQAAVRVSSADGDGFFLCILFALFQFFPGSIVVLLFRAAPHNAIVRCCLKSRANNGYAPSHTGKYNTRPEFSYPAIRPFSGRSPEAAESGLACQVGGKSSRPRPQHAARGWSSEFPGHTFLSAA